MKIKSLTFKDTSTGWNVTNLEFDDLTLLVGASGVGKTRILAAIQALANIADGKAYDAIEWSVSFENSGSDYVWSGEFSNHSEGNLSLFEEQSEIVFLREKLICDGKTIIERSDSEMRYKDILTYKLDQTRSAISLLKEEDDMKPVVAAFSKIRYIRNNRGSALVRNSRLSKIGLTEINDLRKKDSLSPVQMLYLLSLNNTGLFNDIRDDFIDIFPFVQDLNVSIRKISDDFSSPYIRIKEFGIPHWITQEDISSGMFRTLLQITELKMAEDGDVFLMDEFENGLGVNCIDKLADMIINPDRDIQIIVTSHHPYIINNIPVENWKIVTRNKVNVKVLSANDLNVGTRSKHDAFIQLINTDAYKTGVL